MLWQDQSAGGMRALKGRRYKVKDGGTPALLLPLRLRLTQSGHIFATKQLGRLCYSSWVFHRRCIAAGACFIPIVLHPLFTCEKFILTLPLAAMVFATTFEQL